MGRREAGGAGHRQALTIRRAMIITILSVGLPKDTCIGALSSGYLDRIRKFTKIQVKAIKQEPLLPEAGSAALRKEAKKLLELMQGSYNVVLDKDGEMMGSEVFAKFLDMRIMGGTKSMNIIIGGPSGIDMSVKMKADKVLSLSKMTFPHELTMVIIAEQIYRAYTIMRGLPYHR